MSDVVKYDEQRILCYYKNNPQDLNMILTIEHILKNGYVLFLGQLEDLSEEFHRKYEPLYNQYHWNLMPNQLKLSNQFYEEFFNEFNIFRKADLIRNNKVSEEFIKKYSRSFEPEIWKMVYLNV
jgi:hypothetical protein